MNASQIACTVEDDERLLRMIGFCVRRRRLTVGLTQVRLAARARVSTSEIQHIEHARRDPGILALTRVCIALGISFLELMAEVDRVNCESRWARY